VARHQDLGMKTALVCLSGIVQHLEIKVAIIRKIYSDPIFVFVISK